VEESLFPWVMTEKMVRIILIGMTGSFIKDAGAKLRSSTSMDFITDSYTL